MSTTRLSAIAIDCADPAELAEFYRVVLGLHITHSSLDLVVLTGAGVSVNFERIDDHQPPTWPSGAVPKQLHVDLVVDDLDIEEARIIACGATRADIQPNPERWRVLIDPAGHPFCIIAVTS